MTAVNRLLALLGTRLPLIQAPMAGVQGAALAAAVCEAGALGSVPGATHTPDTLRAELTALRAATDRPWNVNFFCHTTPVFEPAREAAWRATLAPFHAEAGIDGSQVPPGAGRRPFSAALGNVPKNSSPSPYLASLPHKNLTTRIFEPKVVAWAITRYNLGFNQSNPNAQKGAKWRNESRRESRTSRC